MPDQLMDTDVFFHDQILTWFATNKRSFPWREGIIDPFVSIITELLLQRTKAEAIAEFYPKLLDFYSTPSKVLVRGKDLIVNDLSVLGLQDRRARSLLAIAASIKDEHGGIVPDDEASLLDLNGVGRYIARAVLCFAFGKPVSIVDGNVTRIFCRFFGMENKGDNRRNKHMWVKGDEIIAIDPSRAKDLNWAILDFAALACVPKNPACRDCCLQQSCQYGKMVEKQD
jgi:A/G-specific adenine glycosylase